MNMINSRTVSEILAEADDVSRWTLLFPGYPGRWVITVVGRTVVVEQPDQETLTQAYQEEFLAYVVGQRTVCELEARGLHLIRTELPPCTCGQCPQNQD